MIYRGMVVVCKTDEEHGCSAAFEARGRKEATLLRKHLYRILPPQLRSSVAAFAGTKQQHIQCGSAISAKARIFYPSYEVVRGRRCATEQPGRSTAPA